MNKTVKKLNIVAWVSLATLSSAVILCIALAYSLYAHFTRSADDIIVPDTSVLSWQPYDRGEVPVETLGITEKPLFWEERVPYIPPVVDESATEQVTEPRSSLKGVSLLGLYVDGNNSYALLKKGNQKYQVKAGDMFEGWQLMSVEYTSATFMSLDDEAVATLQLTDRLPLPQVWNRNDEAILSQ